MFEWVLNAPLLPVKKKERNHFIWKTVSKVTEQLRGDSLLFTTQFPGVPGTNLINFGKMKGWLYLGAPSVFGPGTPG